MLTEVDEIGEPEHAHASEVLGGVGGLEAQVHPPFRMQQARLGRAETTHPQPLQQLLVALLPRIIRSAFELVKALQRADLRNATRIVAAEMCAEHLDQLRRLWSDACQRRLAHKLDT